MKGTLPIKGTPPVNGGDRGVAGPTGATLRGSRNGAEWSRERQP